MGFVLNLGFCEVCGTKISEGERFCAKHKNYAEKDDTDFKEGDKDGKADGDEDDEDEDDEDEDDEDEEDSEG